MRNISNSCWNVSEGRQWKEAEAVGFGGLPENYHACKLRINLPERHYYFFRAMLFGFLLKLTNDACLCGFKTFADAVTHIPEDRFRNAAQFTLYLRSSATLQQIKALIAKIEQFLEEISLPAVMANSEDFSVSDHMSMRWDRFDNGDIYLSEETIKKKAIFPSYQVAVKTSREYLMLHPNADSPYDADIAAMTRDGFMHFLFGNQRPEEMAFGEQCQNLALIAQMLQKGSKTLLPFINEASAVFADKHDSAMRGTLLRSVKHSVDHLIQRKCGLVNFVDDYLKPLESVFAKLEAMPVISAKSFVRVWMRELGGVVGRKKADVFVGAGISGSEKQVVQLSIAMQKMLNKTDSGANWLLQLKEQVYQCVMFDGHAKGCKRHLLVASTRAEQFLAPRRLLLATVRKSPIIGSTFSIRSNKAGADNDSNSGNRTRRATIT